VEALLRNDNRRPLRDLNLTILRMKVAHDFPVLRF
jgi:hypothetical protein